MIAQQKIFFDNSKILSKLDFEFTPLEETLEWAK
jgi:hypothetical protein